MTFLDICAGIGGFRLGFERAGHKCIGFAEINDHAVSAYKAMYNTKGEWYAKDITTIRADDIPKADCWCFGFPCQDISTAGKRAGLEGKRSGLFYRIIELVKSVPSENKPEWLVVENVKNLLSIDAGKGFTEVLSEMDEAGYDVQWQCVDSRWFGVPQHRERVYIIGHLRTKGFRKILPLTESDCETVRPDSQKLKMIRLQKVKSTSCSPAPIAIKNGTPLGYLLAEEGDGMDFGYINSDERRGRVKKGYSGTATTQANLGVCIREGDKLRIRRLTPREYWRLQGFPDDLYDKAAAVVSETQLYKLAGNAVTIPVTEVLGKKLK